MTARRTLLPAAEVALVLVEVAAVATFWRLFADRSFLAPLAVVAVASHLVPLACRRLGLGLPAAAAVWLLGGVLTIAWVLYPATTRFGLPTGTTFDTARTDLSGAWAQFQDVKAPAPAETGFLLAAALAIWAAGFVADWAAFRLWVPFESVVPAATLFVFASLLGADNSRAQAAILFGLAVLGFMLVHRVARQQASANWLASDVGPGTNALLRLGAWLLAGAVVAGAVVAPALPGARADALLGWRDIGEGPDPRTTISPLLQVDGQLDRLAAVELFTVQATERNYWRLASLDRFTGEIWGLSGSYRGASGRLPRAVESEADAREVTQRFTITALGQVWLPAVFEPRAYDGDVGARWDPESSTLIVENDHPSSDGATYTVVSSMPDFERAELAGVRDREVPDDIADRYLELPGDFSARVRALAAEITAAAGTPYEQARALQDWIRDNTVYDLDVDLGFTPADMEAYLFEVRRGFCQQAAGTYAAMARAIGLPARVAVGFTPGDADPADPTLYHVRGEYAHAWPEVFIAGYGWVPFEPTPLRGRPGAEDYTGVPEQQAVGGRPSEATVTPSTVGDPVSEGGEAAAPEGAQPDGGLDAIDPEDLAPLDGDRRSFLERWVPRLAWAAGALLALAAAYVVVTPIVHVLRRRRRRRTASSPPDQVRVAWRESVEAVSVLGLAPRPAETPAEFAGRAGAALEAGLCEPLADALEAVDYGLDPVGADVGEGALATADRVTQAVRASTTREQRLRAVLDPRPADRRHRRRHGPRRRARRRDADDRPAVEVLSLAEPDRQP